jgi:protein-S-isoprenylcysteine O-methyltransferase Ste14
MTAVMSLLVRTLAGFAFLFCMMGLVIFAAAGSLGYWQGWLLIGVFAGASGLITAWLWGHDKALLERRTKGGPASEADPAQNVIQAFAGLIFLGTLAVPALDHRFGWSSVPPPLVFVGDGLVAIGFLVVFLTFRENTFTSGTIEIAEDQRVIDTGPYALVRHPMYAGALILFAGMPLALGSWWGLLVAAGVVPTLAWRLLLEETFLDDHLIGYRDYRSRVRFRLAPGVW